MASAFQPSAFQLSAFQIDGGAPAPTPLGHGTAQLHPHSATIELHDPPAATIHPHRATTEIHR